MGEAISAWEGQELCFPAFVSVHVSVTSEFRWPPRRLSRSEPGQASPLSGLSLPVYN